MPRIKTGTPPYDHDQEKQHHQEIEPPLLAAWLDGLDREFDRETALLLHQADQVIESLRLESRRASRSHQGRPKGQKAAA